MHLFEEPGKDLTLHLICGCAWGAVKSWDGWGRELCCAPLVCPWDSEQTLPALCSFLVDFLPWIITHVKPHTLDILRGRSKRKGCNCANSSGQETRGTMSFGQNKLLFGVLVLIILAVVSWRDTYRVAERCLSARGRKSISYKTLRVLTRIYTEQIAINFAVWWMASGLYFIAWF